jgi:hypothetical protein
VEPHDPFGRPAALPIEALLKQAQHRARVASTLYDLLRDALDPEILARGCPDRLVLETLLPVALNAAADQALTTLAAGISPAFDACADIDLERLALGRRWREMGWG